MPKIDIIAEAQARLEAAWIQDRENREDGFMDLKFLAGDQWPNEIRLQREPFDAAAEAAKLTRGRTDIGAVVTFTGICRGDEAGAPIAALTLEHYPGMAEAEIERHVAEAVARWPVSGVTVIHRFGRITPGEDIVLVVTASSHRAAAFAAAEFLMDYLKTRAPFWKQVEKTGAKTWVEAKAADDTAAGRWQKDKQAAE